MNMFKKNGGFTLVELIVVIAILAILAAVAIPAYSGYISKAQEANDMTLLDSVKTAVVFAVMDEDYNAKVYAIEVGTDATKVKATVALGNDNKLEGTGEAADTVIEVDISDYIEAETITYKSTSKGAKLDLTAATPQWVLTPAA